MANLIGLGGYAYSGKDAFADVLEGLGWYKTYMSKYLRQSLEVLNPIIGYDVLTGEVTRFKDAIDQLGYEEAKTKAEVRRLLQVFGTEVGRELYAQDFWLDLCFKDVDREMRNGNDVVVTGIRYHNELKMINKFGGKSVWVSRPGHAAINGHSSDNTLKMEDFDHIFDNNGTLADLDHAVPEFVRVEMDIPVILPKRASVDRGFQRKWG